MASWIGATPEQRFWQYILPAAKRSISSGDWDTYIAAYDTKIEKAQAAVNAAEVGSHSHRSCTRRLASLQDERAGVIKSRQQDLDTIAEGERRREDMKKAQARRKA